MKTLPLRQTALIAMRRLLNQTGIRKKKVFAVGFNKTGTSSLHALFRSLGLPSYHGPKWRGCNDLKMLRAYDCFSDGIPKDLSKLDGLFPGSKFILQVRDLESWIYSRLAHIARGKEENTHKDRPRWNDTEHDIKRWIKRRNNHHLFVLSYFSQRPSDILVVNFVRDESAATKICEFLGYEGTYERPEMNVRSGKEPLAKHVEMLRRCVAELEIPEQELKYDIYCPSLVRGETHAGFPADTRMLETGGK